MTTITVIMLDQQAFGLDMDGHAGYGSEGSDIVCAGLSAITYALAEYLLQSGGAKVSDLVLRPGHVRIRCTGEVAEAFRMAYIGYAMLESQYPEHIFLDTCGFTDASVPLHTLQSSCQQWLTHAKGAEKEDTP